MARSEFAIVGAGALGSILAAHLLRNGRSVALLARGQRAQQLREQGLRIKGLSEISMPVEVVTDPAQVRETGTLIIATKTPGSEQTMASLRHVQVDRAVSIQNGVMKDELLSQTYGRERTLGALADTSGELLASGEVLFTRNVNLFIGELDGAMSDTARGIVKTIDDAGVRATLVPDIVSREWSKFVGWVGFVSLSLTTRVATWKFLSDPDAALLIARLTRELGSLARALGIALTEDRAILPLGLVMNGTEAQAVAAVQRVGADYQTKAPEHRMSSLQDLLAARPLEIHETLGYALRKGQELNLPMPLLGSLYSLVSAIDRTRDR
ncbi:ketopantoate reductase family protein [Peristeroidobacter agariperforans]|uniref:ketopantoate reductase family protein n=1 Tax=Peristeroidobacter agariperforans TaxID=268404 RepID=UPI00101D0148|nr:2-dehydropantoate 2-reductase [Peristeroidobacter agariperforans]